MDDPTSDRSRFAPRGGGWVWQHDPDRDFVWHEMPVGDLIDHDPCQECICGPIIRCDKHAGITVLRHSSLDGRDAVEAA